MNFTTLKPATRTEAEARAEGHTPTPWEFRRQQPREIALKRPHFEIGAPHGKGVGIIFLTQEGTEADAHFVKLAVNSHDAMKAALIGAVTTLRRVQAADRAGAWPWIDEAISGVSAALDLARGAKP